MKLSRKFLSDYIDLPEGLTINELAKMVKRYKDSDAWMKDTYFTEKSFDHLQDIMISAGELQEKVPYKKLVNTTFSKKK